MSLKRSIMSIFLFILLLLVMAGCSRSSLEESPVSRDHKSTQVDIQQPIASNLNPLRNVYFGDLHLHTGNSFDAAASSVKTTPDDAYRYALGEPIQYMGKTIQRLRPLDFLAVTDHAEYLSIYLEAAKPDGLFADTEWPAKIAAFKNNVVGGMRLFVASALFGTEPPIAEFVTSKMVQDNWARQIAAAEAYNQPGQFTAFVAYEWSATPAESHLHRNVIFKGPSYPDMPFSAMDSLFPEDLWTYAENNRAQGIDSILIPHNANLSNGMMFDYKDSYGDPLTEAYARRRSENERLVEIFQNKGGSETIPAFSPDDEFADFELIPMADNTDTAGQAGGFVRPALKRGLEMQYGLKDRKETKQNPFQFGFVGATDFHSGASSSEENNFPGGLGLGDSHDDPKKTLTELNPVTNMPLTIFSAGGITAVWAEENTREAIFSAMKRRETYATSGTRIRVRLFAGTEYPKGIMQKADWLSRAYENGVPMGGDMMPDTGKKAPRFLLQAVKDPDGANLDRIQIIKIWIAGNEVHEKVFDALWNDNREITPDGKLPPAGNTVDTQTATWTNTIGASMIRGEWQDPAFDPDQPSLYYARVLEIPTPRWPTYLAVKNSLPLTEHSPATFQERAWTSPIYYTPKTER